MTDRLSTQDQNPLFVIRHPVIGHSFVIRHSVIRHSLLLLAFCSLFSIDSMGQISFPGITTRAGSEVRISLEGYYDALPPAGYVPTLVKISNNTDRKHAWEFRFQSTSSHTIQSRIEYVWTAEVGARQEKSFEVLVPVASRGEGGRSFPSMVVHVEGYGLEGRTGQYAVNQRYSRHNHTPFTGLSPQLELHSKATAVAHLQGMSREFAGCQINPGWLSEDWKAYIGFGSIFFTESDWRQVSTGDRAAILNWVAHGGRLVYFTENPGADAVQRAGLPATGAGVAQSGFGTVEAIRWDGQSVPPQKLAALITQADIQNHAQDLAMDYSTGWPLRDVVPASKPNAALLVFSVLAFALLVGPVNLVVFAGKRRRHRLFITTPLISVAASLIMIGIIIMEDGIGGTGARVATMLLMPDEHQVLHIQEQISRTGVLLGNRFGLRREIYMAQPVVDRVASAPMQRLSRRATTASGDWFASRSYQAQYLSEIRPSRARVDRVDAPQDDTPILLSMLDEDLVNVFYIDDRGEYWFANRLEVGRRTPMQSSSRSTFSTDFWVKEVLESGVRAGGNIRSLRDNSGTLFGIMENPEKHFVDTHSAIGWKEDRLLVVGPCRHAGGGGA
jgi:hypothetical protein